MSERVLIAAGVRTPIGAMNGALASVPAPRLGAICIAALMERLGIRPHRVDDVIMGNVVGAGLGQNPARQAALFAGLAQSTPACTVNKVCGSGLKAVMLAAQAIRLGESGLIVAGGMENMSRAPYLLTRAREGYRLGHGEILDAMITDGLWDVYNQKHMGTCGDLCAHERGLSRQEQDDFAVSSFVRARQAIEAGWFAREIAPVEVKAKGTTTVIKDDEGPARFQEAKLRALAPAFDAEGTITAGNASSIGDGAAALVIASQARCDELGVAPIASIVGATTFAQAPEWFTTAPVFAIRKLLDKVGWTLDQVDLFEINEAFAVVALYAERALGLDRERLNLQGGAVALGNPIGASGARILVTLLSALARTGGRRGVASLCIGGGEAVAMAVERV